MKRINRATITKPTTYKIVLSKFGKEIYKGGNIEVMKPLLSRTTVADSMKKAEQWFDRQMMETVGWSNQNLFKLEVVK